MKRLVAAARRCARAARAGRRIGAPARQLHDQPLRARRGLRATASTSGTSLDMAEIPTYQAGDRRLARTRASRSHRRREPVAARSAHALAHPRGAGGLHTTRLELDPRAARSFTETNTSPTATRTTRTASAGRRSSSAPTRQLASDELRAYPKDLLQSPLEVDVGHRDARPDARSRAADALSGKALRRRTASRTPASRSCRPRQPLARSSSSRRSPPRCSGAPRTPCRRGTGRRSSPRTSSASAERRATRRCSG